MYVVCFFFFVISRQPPHTSRTLRAGENHTLVYYTYIRAPAKQEIEHAMFWRFSIKHPIGVRFFSNAVFFPRSLLSATVRVRSFVLSHHEHAIVVIVSRAIV